MDKFLQWLFASGLYLFISFTGFSTVVGPASFATIFGWYLAFGMFFGTIPYLVVVLTCVLTSSLAYRFWIIGIPFAIATVVVPNGVTLAFGAAAYAYCIAAPVVGNKAAKALPKDSIQGANP
jgi:hypothetical protein